MPDDASAAEEPAVLAGRVRSALESGDLDAIRDLLDPGARWGAPEGPGDADCRNRDQVTAWWASARAADGRAVVTEVTVGPRDTSGGAGRHRHAGRSRGRRNGPALAGPDRERQPHHRHPRLR